MAARAVSQWHQFLSTRPLCTLHSVDVQYEQEGGGVGEGTLPSTRPPANPPCDTQEASGLARVAGAPGSGGGGGGGAVATAVHRGNHARKRPRREPPTPPQRLRALAVAAGRCPARAAGLPAKSPHARQYRGGSDGALPAAAAIHARHGSAPTSGRVWPPTATRTSGTEEKTPRRPPRPLPLCWASWSVCPYPAGPGRSRGGPSAQPPHSTLCVGPPPRPPRPHGQHDAPYGPRRRAAPTSRQHGRLAATDREAAQ